MYFYLNIHLKLLRWTTRQFVYEYVTNLFENVFWRHVHQRLLGTRRHTGLDHNDGSMDVLLLHSLTIGSGN